MSLKVAFLCFQAFFLQDILCQCYGNQELVISNGCADNGWTSNGWAGNGCGSGIAAAAPQWADGIGSASASNGGSLVVISSSPIAPGILSVQSENAIEGSLSVAGALPFLSAVALEGALSTGGSGIVTYGCGNGNVAILNDNIGAAESLTAAGIAGIGAGIVGNGAGFAGVGANGWNGVRHSGCGSPIVNSGINGGCGCY